MRKMLPNILKVYLKLILRFINDYKKGNYSKFAKNRNHSNHYDFKISLSQEILTTSLVLNKIENIKIAIKKINQVIIKPGEIFSFWKIVGNPNKKNGFKKGRNIINGTLMEDYGGGLCQLSGIIYYISLIANLEIVERHNHTVDIYKDNKRYAPLGSDATVVYGYKDLRIINNKNFVIKFLITIEDSALVINILSDEKIETQQINFITIGNEKYIEIHTINEFEKIIAKSIYNYN